jgi:riboflavin kinase/FMN adenylyltransferase
VELSPAEAAVSRAGKISKYPGTFAAIGFFDGVHRGHRYLIEQLKQYALSEKLPAAVITFPQHPRKVLQQDYQPKLLNTFDERMQQLTSTGVDYCYLIEFSKAFSETSAKDFIQEILYKQLNVKGLLIGYDHRFGKNCSESFEQYVEYGKACGMKVFPAAETDEHISSTTIRQLLSEGKVDIVAQKLSCFYCLEGEVVHGNHLGRTIGFPTANLRLNDPNKMIPLEGVYAARVSIGENHYGGMAYIGTRPTVVAQGEQRIEVNIFNFDCDIYGEILRLELIAFTRPDIHFQGLEALTAQLTADRSICRGKLFFDSF